MDHESARRPSTDLEEVNERVRREVMKAIEPYGQRPVSDLVDMSDNERTKWLFWNLHENLDEVRALEPSLIGQVIRTQLTVSDGQSMWTDKFGLEKRAEFSCKWQLLLKPSSYEAEQAYSISEGWIDLFIGDRPPPHPSLQPGQKGYLDSDSALYPNQLFLYGWVSEGVWQEIKAQLYNASSNCHTDIFLRDNFLFPVKPGLGFLSGPAGSIGITNIEFRTSSQPRLTSWVRS
ncbi:hypothetical protein RCH09_003053 [Actimicrobium sp. GrIS 1.19]|uniref:hypothetical protein n=1 Tax=Actimicrobium sp. GrIS 1.19 TaxID=3071708 RepID=UPI002DFB446B|nr:hypothetical protein [Actimicrobium sp. GrIS 1.19]